jgi:hypothetical protein
MNPPGTRQDIFKPPTLSGGMDYRYSNDQSADTELQKEHAGEGLQKFNQALGIKSSLNQMDSAFDDLAAKGGFTVQGSFGRLRGETSKLGETLQSITGKPLDIDLAAKNADVQLINKLNSTLAFQFRDQMDASGARGLGVLMTAGGAIPSMENTPLAAKELSAGLKGLSDWEINRYKFKDAWQAQHHTLIGSDDAYNAQYPPLEAAKTELDKIGIHLNEKGQQVFKDEPSLIRAYRAGLFGKPKSKEAESAYQDMHNAMFK